MDSFNFPLSHFLFCAFKLPCEHRFKLTDYLRCWTSFKRVPGQAARSLVHQLVTLKHRISARQAPDCLYHGLVFGTGSGPRLQHGLPARARTRNQKPGEFQQALLLLNFKPGKYCKEFIFPAAHASLPGLHRIQSEYGELAPLLHQIKGRYQGCRQQIRGVLGLRPLGARRIKNRGDIVG